MCVFASEFMIKDTPKCFGKINFLVADTFTSFINNISVISKITQTRIQNSEQVDKVLFLQRNSTFNCEYNMLITHTNNVFFLKKILYLQYTSICMCVVLFFVSLTNSGSSQTLASNGDKEWLVYSVHFWMACSKE